MWLVHYIIMWDSSNLSTHGKWKLSFDISLPFSIALAFYISKLSYILTCFHFVWSMTSLSCFNCLQCTCLFSFLLGIIWSPSYTLKTSFATKKRKRNITLLELYKIWHLSSFLIYFTLFFYPVTMLTTYLFFLFCSGVRTNIIFLWQFSSLIPNKHAGWCLLINPTHTWKTITSCKKDLYLRYGLLWKMLKRADIVQEISDYIYLDLRITVEQCLVNCY
jgi:hypothetical protein